MATQPVSQAGAVYSKGALIDVTSPRAISAAGAAYATGRIVDFGVSRPISGTGAEGAIGGFARLGATRVLTRALGAYATEHFLALSSFRALSQAIASYVFGGLLRTGAARALSLGYSLLVPVPPPPPPPPSDTAAPLVGNFSPAVGTPISKGTSISFDVTDDSGAFRKIFVVAFFPDTGVSELIHDGDGFRGFYAATSSRRAVTRGFRYTVLRGSGWPAAPTIQTFAIDLAGNEAN